MKSPSPAKDSLAAYSDVRTLWTTAREREGLVYVLPSSGKAVNVMQRCYRYRKMLYRLNAEQLDGMPGVSPSTPFDHLSIRREGKRLIFFVRGLEGELFDNEGERIEPRIETEVAEDELTEAARAARKSLGLEIEE